MESTLNLADSRFHENVATFNFGNCTDADAENAKIFLTLYKALEDGKMGI